jgi:hypothetical protein
LAFDATLAERWAGTLKKKTPILSTEVTVTNGLRCLQHKYFSHLPEEISFL